MILNSIQTINFRNLNQIDLSFNSKTNIFIGENGQGKTNLLESIYLLSLARSFKTNKFNDIALYKTNHFYIKGEIEKNHFTYEISLNYENNQKSILINQSRASKYKDILGLLNVVLFVPEDLSLLKSSPSVRRKLLDIELSKINFNYLSCLSGYYNALKERNTLLKTKSIDKYYLDTLNDLLIKYGSQIILFREKFIQDLIPLIDGIYKKLSQSDQSISMNYLPNTSIDLYKENLDKSYQRDLMSGFTNLGIHKDDFKVYLNERDASIYASQGEQRSIVLSIKLALVHYIKSKSGSYPILLLDDVLSELDDSRQENLIDYLQEDIQTFISTTSLKNINEKLLEDSYLFKVSNGNIERCD